MVYVGVDLHKKTVSICVVNQDRVVLQRKRFACCQTEQIREYFAGLGSFRVVVEATASYQWFVQLVEPLADRVVLAHPKKLRIIAESTCKSDKIDAEILARFLALDMIPEAYRATPRQQEHRALVRHRDFVQRRITSARIKIRRVLSNYNADRQDLFTHQGLEYLKTVALSGADEFLLKQLWQQWTDHCTQLDEVMKQLRAFAKNATIAEAEARALLRTIPGIGEITTEVVLSELGDFRRFRSQKQVCAYAGLAPGRRESAGKAKDLGITKEGSRLLRWVLIEAAWQTVRYSRRWETIFERLAHRRGKKKAIVAVARRLLCVIFAILKSGQPYQFAMTEKTA